MLPCAHVTLALEESMKVMSHCPAWVSMLIRRKSSYVHAFCKFYAIIYAPCKHSSVALTWAIYIYIYFIIDTTPWMARMHYRTGLYVIDMFYFMSTICLLLCCVILSCALLLFTACPGPPEAPTLVSGVPPNAALSWSPPSASGAWSYMYEVSWTNGSNIVSRQAGTTAQIPGLQAETQYTVVITAYPVNTLCPNQSTMFTFMTTQSE